MTTITVKGQVTLPKHVRHEVGLNEVVFAELSARMESEAHLGQALVDLKVMLARMPLRALFNAGKTYRHYRTRGGPRTTVLADFFIGAHAEAAQWPILTRDVRRYRTYYPNVKLITSAA